LDLVVERTNSPSMRGLLQFGFSVPYSTLKNYHNESRMLPEDLFLDLCSVAKINIKNLKFEYLSKNWGQVKGGKVGKR